jgi:signal transduction histidine kinase/ActR/RegA family two-component response regulator
LQALPRLVAESFKVARWRADAARVTVQQARESRAPGSPEDREPPAPAARRTARSRRSHGKRSLATPGLPNPAKRGAGGSWLLTPIVCIALVAVAGAGFGITRHAANTQEAGLLHERASEVALILSTATSLTSSLQVIGDVYAGGGESAQAFAAGARSLVSGAVTTVGVAAVVGDDVVVRAVQGTGAAVGDALGAERAALVRRTLGADGLTTMLIRGQDASTLLVALRSQDGLVVWEESLIANRPAPSTAASPFHQLNAVLYRTPTPDPNNLLIATDALPLHGTIDSRELTFGTEQWLLQTSARESLTSAQTRAVPWIILGGGLAAAFLAAVVVFLLTRRRAYAIALVDQRTSDLRRTMTELQMARASADTANQAKSQFLSRMSHELRTPLNAVLGFAQLLELDNLTTDQGESVGHILKGGSHLLNLINEVLDISRIESGDIALSPEAVLAADVIAETIDLMRPLAAGRSIHFPADRQSTCVHYVFADRQRLKQILLNLVSNAVKYNRAGGTVAITCEQIAATRLRINVTDSGDGITEQDLQLLFVPFQRLGAGMTDIEGTGIGLALSLRLAEAMGGSLQVRSRVGEGSTFWVELPLVEGPVERYERLSTSAAPVPAPPISAPRQTVLYIEDNLANITLVQRILAQRPDIELLPAMQGRLGIELAQQHHPDLILLDLHLPDLLGDEVLQILRDDPRTSSIPVVVISADATIGHVQRLRSAGATGYLTKPFNVGDLLRTINDTLTVDKTPT